MFYNTYSPSSRCSPLLRFTFSLGIMVVGEKWFKEDRNHAWKHLWNTFFLFSFLGNHVKKIEKVKNTQWVSSIVSWFFKEVTLILFKTWRKWMQRVFPKWMEKTYFIATKKTFYCFPNVSLNFKIHAKSIFNCFFKFWKYIILEQKSQERLSATRNLMGRWISQI